MFKPDDIAKLVDVMTQHSCGINRGDKVIVESVDGQSPLVEAIIGKVFALGGIPILQEKRQATMAAFARHATAEAYAIVAEKELSLMKQAKHFIGIRQPDCSNAFGTVPGEKLKLLLENFVQPVHYNYRNHHLNWVYLRGISPHMIAKSGMGQEEFVEYYTNAILIDYVNLDKLLEPLKTRMEKTRSVRVIGPGRTDLRFKLGGYGVFKSVGRHNLPDGEIFTAPIKESAHGWIEFNVDSVYYNSFFSGVQLRFEEGKVVEAYANDTNKLNELLDVDAGARYIGEFALGVNPKVTTPVNDILFDEKMFGSLHIALGNAYPVADNKNRSAIHWDLILDQTGNQGGGEVYFDGQLVRKDGLFSTTDLEPLNFK